MANKNRVLYNDHMICMVDIDDTTVVEQGDSIVRAGSGDVSADATLTLGYGCPADYMADAGDAAANRATFAAQLIGIALQPKAVTDNDEKIAVGYNGTFILDQATGAAIQIGDNLEGYSDATYNEAQTFVEGDTSVIGTCIKTKTTTTAVTEVEVFLQPPLMNV